MRSGWLTMSGLVAAISLSACVDPTGPETQIQGEDLYRQYCARCHGLDGAGVAEQPATKDMLSSFIRMKGLSDEQIEGVIRVGKPPGMPGFGGDFTDAKLMVLTAFVRTLSAASTAQGAAPSDAKQP